MSGPLSSRSGPDLRIVGVVCAIAAAILLTHPFVGRAALFFFADTDDAMRMVMVRDFLAGQGWYDLTVHRLNTPWGAEIHWSRLVDVPLALLVSAFTPLLGDANALLVAGTIWPMFLLAVLLWLSAKLAFRLVGPQGVLPALILPILSPAITAEFTPGRVDHHSVIILLTLTITWASVEAVRRPYFAILAGVFTATALAIAIESAPAIAAAVLVFGFAFVLETKRARAMRLFGLSFGLISVLHLAIFRPPARWLEAACDVISPFYVGGALVVGLVFMLASFLPLRNWWQRLALLALPGLAGILVLVGLFPQCLKGPYGNLDPWLQANWIAAIVEAKPWLFNLAEMPAYALAVGVPVLLAVVIVCLRLWRVRQDRAEWAVLLVFLVAMSLVMLAQVRGARLAIMLAMPAAAWLIVSARQRYLAKASAGNIIGLLVSWLAFAGVVLALAVTGIQSLLPSDAAQVAEQRGNAQACLVPGAFTDLALMPPKRIMAPIDLGAHVLLYTSHSVVAAPYHRNQQGVLDTFRFFNEPIGTARMSLAERGIDLVVLCPGMPEVSGFPDQAPDSFAALFASNTLPPWLQDVSVPGSPLRIYMVTP